MAQKVKMNTLFYMQARFLANRNKWGSLLWARMGGLVCSGIVAYFSPDYSIGRINQIAARCLFFCFIIFSNC
jgi:uncharacterized membrane protein